VFKILADNSKKTLEPLYGALRGILVSDRAKALNFWAMERRQICWAHLLLDEMLDAFTELLGIRHVRHARDPYGHRTACAFDE
jgi:hypothetical protein